VIIEKVVEVAYCKEILDGIFNTKKVVGDSDNSNTVGVLNCGETRKFS
jgi:hypothetical protein